MYVSIVHAFITIAWLLLPHCNDEIYMKNFGEKFQKISKNFDQGKANTGQNIFSQSIMTWRFIANMECMFADFFMVTNIWVNFQYFYVIFHHSENFCLIVHFHTCFLLCAIIIRTWFCVAQSKYATYTKSEKANEI